MKRFLVAATMGLFGIILLAGLTMYSSMAARHQWGMKFLKMYSECVQIVQSQDFIAAEFEPGTMTIAPTIETARGSLSGSQPYYLMVLDVDGKPYDTNYKGPTRGRVQISMYSTPGVTPRESTLQPKVHRKKQTRPRDVPAGVSEGNDKILGAKIIPRTNQQRKPAVVPGSDYGGCAAFGIGGCGNEYMDEEVLAQKRKEEQDYQAAMSELSGIVAEHKRNHPPISYTLSWMFNGQSRDIFGSYDTHASQLEMRLDQVRRELGLDRFPLRE